MIVSEALQRPVSVTYVSLPPGTMPHVVSIRIRNASAGGPVSPTIPLVNGGFDPVAVPASPDDRLELQLTDHDGNVTEEIAMVPIKRPPVVVRISPPNGRTDVALSVHPGVVFSEPVDPSTLAVGMRLVTGSLMVTGRIELREPWRAELAPDSPLAPGTTYRVELTREIRGADGEPLERPAEAAFTTAAGPPLPEAPLSRMRIAFVSSRGRLRSDLPRERRWLRPHPSHGRNGPRMVVGRPPDRLPPQWPVRSGHRRHQCRRHGGADTRPRDVPGVVA